MEIRYEDEVYGSWPADGWRVALRAYRVDAKAHGMVVDTGLAVRVPDGHMGFIYALPEWVRAGLGILDPVCGSGWVGEKVSVANWGAAYDRMYIKLRGSSDDGAEVERNIRYPHFGYLVMVKLAGIDGGE